MKVCLALLLLFLLMVRGARAAEDDKKEYPPALDFKVKTLEGKDVHLGKKYEGQVVLLVNVASRCGYTPQYKGLQALHKEYAEQGLAIVGVPCNQFGKQEPGTSEEIAEFCEANYGVEFDMLAKTNVRADQDDQSPLYKYLTSEETNPDHGGDIKWNFEKFLIGRDGKVVGHYRSGVSPDSEEFVDAVKAELAKPAPEVAK